MSFSIQQRTLRYLMMISIFRFMAGKKSLIERYRRLYMFHRPAEDVSSKKAQARFIAYINKKYGNGNAHTLLDLACGSGLLLFELKGKYELTGLDIDKKCINEGKQYVKWASFVLGNMLDFKLDQAYDIITCFDAIDHGSDLRVGIQKTLSNAYKHLTLGGLLIFTMPLARETWENGQSSADRLSVKDEKYIWIHHKYVDRDRLKSCMAVVLFKGNKVSTEFKIGEMEGRMLHTLDVAKIAQRLGFRVHIFTAKGYKPWTSKSDDIPIFVCVKQS